MPKGDSLSINFTRGSLGSLYLEKGWANPESWGVKNKHSICFIKFHNINFKENSPTSLHFYCKCLVTTEVYLHGVLISVWQPSDFSFQTIQISNYALITFRNSFLLEFHLKEASALLLISVTLKSANFIQSAISGELDKILSVYTNKINPIYITGIPRSGTTILFKSLRESFGLSSNLVESFFYNSLFSRFKNKNERYCTNAYIGKKLAAKFLRIRKKCFQCINYDDLIKLSRIYYFYANKSHLYCVIDKTPSHIFYASIIFDSFPDAKIIFCTRPASQVFASYRKRLQFEKNRKGMSSQSDWLNLSIEEFISTYEDYHHSALDAIYKFPNKIFVLKYNKLVSRDENTLIKLSEFLNISLDKLKASFYKPIHNDIQQDLLSRGLQNNLIEVDKYISSDERSLLDHMDFNFYSENQKYDC